MSCRLLVDVDEALLIDAPRQPPPTCLEFMFYALKILQVMQMDDQHPEYDPDLFIHFVGEVSKNLATMAGRTKVMYKGNTMAAKAMMALQVCGN